MVCFGDVPGSVLRERSGHPRTIGVQPQCKASTLPSDYTFLGEGASHPVVFWAYFWLSAQRSLPEGSEDYRVPGSAAFKASALPAILPL